MSKHISNRDILRNSILNDLLKMLFETNVDVTNVKMHLHRVIDDKLAFHRNFFTERDLKDDLSYKYLYNGLGLISTSFFLNDGDNTLNLSEENSSPLLPTISIPLNLSPFTCLSDDEKTELTRILNRAFANMPFAKSKGYKNAIIYEPKQILFILKCYIDAIEHCINRGDHCSDDFKLEKEVFGEDFQSFILKHKEPFSKLIPSNNDEDFNVSLLYNDYFNYNAFQSYVEISQKEDVSYQAIYDRFHHNTFFSVPAFFVLYASLYKYLLNPSRRPFSKEKNIWPRAYLIPVKYETPENSSFIVTAVCIYLGSKWFLCYESNAMHSMEESIIQETNSFMQEFMRKIKDSYLYNKQMRELEEKRMREEHNFKLRYEDRKRSCIEELHQRAIQHDIDSHVLSKYVSEQALEQIDINNLNNYTPLQKEETLPSKFALLARLNQYRTQLSAYCTDLHAGAPLSRSVITIRSLLAFLDQNRLLMNDVSGAGSSFKYRLKIFFDNEQEPAEMSDKRFDQQIFIPNGQLGCQAFYMIVNNVIRNTAKHVKRTNTQNEVSICIRFLEKIRPTYTLRPSEKDKNISEIVAHNAQNSMVYGEIERKLYTVEIFSNVIQENITNLVRNQNERICEPFVNKETLEKRTTNKGLGEMLCAATYLRGKDVVTANEEENIPDWENFDSIEHINILNQNEEPVMLKAFGLIPLNSCDIIMKSWSQFDPEQMVLTPSGMIVNGHQVADSENNRHTCYSWDEVDEMDGIANSYNGFLGYRFFMLKPEQVLVVRDDNSNISNNKAEEVAKHIGVDVVSAEELRNQLEKGVPVNHDILVCDDKELIGEYSAMLPARILTISDIQDFTEPSEDKTGGSEGNDKPDTFVTHCWEKWVDYLQPDIREYGTYYNDCLDKAYFDDHLNSGIDSFEVAVKEAGYAEALSSSAQQHLPDYEANAWNANLAKNDLTKYLNNINKEKGIAHHRLLESINTRILIVDERIQQKSQDIPSLGGDNKITYQCHWKKCHIDLPDVILSASSREEIAKKILDIIDGALERTDYHFIFIHLGLLEGVFSTLYPTDMNKVRLHEKMEEIAAKGKGRVVFESGRGVPDYLPVRARFVQQVSAENALVEKKSKYLFTTLLHNSRAVSPTI